MLNNTAEKTSLGFSWSYKETQKIGDSYLVRTVSGLNTVAEGYPKEHRNKKDFGCLQVFEGDSSRLAAEKEEFLGLIQESLLELNDSEYYKNEYAEYVQEFPGTLTYAAFIAYKSAQLAQVHLAFSRLSMPHAWVQEYLSEFDEFKNEDTYFICAKLDQDRYEKSIAQALS